MEIKRIGHGYETSLGDYCGARIEENGISKFEVRLTGTAVAVIDANKDIYGNVDVFDWIEQVALAIYSTGEVEKFEVIMIDSTYIDDKPYLIKNWRRLLIK